MKKNVAILIGAILLSVSAYGQNDILLTQQMFSRMNFNPAATGASRYFNVFFLGRMQWVGLDGAPNTQYLDVHKYLPRYNSGVGLAFVHDKIGIENTYNVKLNYAYHIRLSRQSYLSLGLAAGVLYRDVSGDRIFENPSPNGGGYFSDSKLSPDFDFGIEYGYKNLLLGASITHLNNKPVSGSAELLSGRQIYGYAQYHIPVGSWKISPGAIFTNQLKTLNTDVICIGTYKQVAWLGASTRLSEKFKSTSISALAGVWIFDNLRIGYSYDYSLKSQVADNSGSHEVMLHWRFGGKSVLPARSPRFIEF